MDRRTHNSRRVFPSGVVGSGLLLLAFLARVFPRHAIFCEVGLVFSSRSYVQRSELEITLVLQSTPPGELVPPIADTTQLRFEAFPSSDPIACGLSARKLKRVGTGSSAEFAMILKQKGSCQRQLPFKCSAPNTYRQSQLGLALLKDSSVHGRMVLQEFTRPAELKEGVPGASAKLSCPSARSASQAS
jgi:hypothetical protein